MLFGKKSEKTVKSKKYGIKTTTKKKQAKPVKLPEEIIVITDDKLKPGDPCPNTGCAGKVYKTNYSRDEVYEGKAPFAIKVFLYLVLRCNQCGEYFTPDEPQEVKEIKASGISALALYRYGFGLPHYRIAEISGICGVPFAKSTQWDLLSKNFFMFESVFKELVKKSADCSLLFFDDTHIKILNKKSGFINGSKRKKISTSGFLCEDKDYKISLFFTGHRNAGENLDRILQLRNYNLPPPILMSDASTTNLPINKKSVHIAFCNVHGRRYFMRLQEHYEKECSVVIQCYRRIYKNDRFTKNNNYNPVQRLEYHKKHSSRYFVLIYKWLNRLTKLKLIEPNSSFGEAVKYMFRNKKYLEMFLKIPGCPLDNNAAERELKRVITHRKNSLFYKTQRGADIGDMFMSIINTCRNNDINAMKYLNTVILNYKSAKLKPEKWMPWNFNNNL